MSKIAFITGASSGIGYATAIELANQNFNLIICGRRLEKLEALTGVLSTKVKVITLCFDVQVLNQVKESIESLPYEWRQIDVLINNAGNAHGLASLAEGEIDDWNLMIDSNVKGLLNVSKLIIPGMIERKRGHIVNLSSIAGKQTYANGVVYCATKKAVEAISEGMRLELACLGIRVTNIAPGAVNTEFSKVRFKGDEVRASKVYEGFEPLRPEDIAKAISFAISAPPNVTIADIVILPTAQASPTTIYRKS